MKYLIHIAKRIAVFLLLVLPFMALADGIVYDPRIDPLRTVSWDAVTQYTDDSAIAPPVTYSIYLQFEQNEPEPLGVYSELMMTFSIADSLDGQYHLYGRTTDGNSIPGVLSDGLPFMVARPIPKPPALRME